MIYQVKDWQKHFENSKSREREKCGFVCVPNKQHGMGFAKIMIQKDGAAIYGIWICILGALSQQANPRNGWLTDDGKQDGRVWTAEDLALKFRRPVNEVSRALEVTSSEDVGWIVPVQCPPATRRVPAECPSGTLEEKRREEKEGNGSRTPISPLGTRVGSWFGRRLDTAWTEKELKALKMVEETPEEEILLLESYYMSDAPYKRRDIVTLLNNWNGEIDRARGWKANPNPNAKPNHRTEQASRELQQEINIPRL